MECGCLVRNTPELPGQKPLNENFKKQENDSDKQKRISYVNSSHVVRVFEVLDTLRKDEVLCDIKLETKDGTLVLGHKVVLASATPYFRAMFTNFKEREKSHVILQELDSTAVKLLVDFIYTGQIMVTEDNVQVLLQAANLLQLYDVKEVCCDFLQSHLNPENCLGFKAIVSLYDCEEYLSSFKYYVLQHFFEVVEDDDLLNLSCDELIDLISCNELYNSSEKKVNYNLSNRNDVFSKLVKHGRLPLGSKEYFCNTVREEPLLKSSVECKDNVEEALSCYLLKSKNSDKICTKPRRPVDLSKVILIVGKSKNKEEFYIHWFDISTEKWQMYSELPSYLSKAKLTVLNDRILFFLRENCEVYKLDLFSQSPCITQSVPMLNERILPGVGVIDNCLYVVGGCNDDVPIHSAEVFDYSTQNWQMISEMSIARSACNVGVLNNHLYAVGGYGIVDYLKSVERYCPKTNTWARISDMNEERCYPGIGIVNGILYAVGGFNHYGNVSSIEAFNPSYNTWTIVKEMHEVGDDPEVAALNGLLCVISNEVESDNHYSAETYDPKSYIWFKLTHSIDINDLVGTEVINKPPYCQA